MEGIKNVFYALFFLGIVIGLAFAGFIWGGVWIVHHLHIVWRSR